MFKSLYLILLFLINFNYSQNNPISWSTSVIDNGNNEYTLVTKGVIKKGWRLYAQNLPDGGALPTEFIFSDNSLFSYYGNVVEPIPITKFDPIFNMDQSYFIDEITYYQDVTLKENYSNDIINQKLFYQVCDDRVCIFRDVSLEFNLKSNSFISLKSFDYNSVSSDLIKDFGNKELIVNNISLVSDDRFSRRLNILLLGLIGGFLALLTPCVFPMIPLTVSFFSSKNENSKFYSISYGLFIILIYLSLSIPFYFLENINPEILNQISTSPILNFLFFIIFIVFALSLFGLFEISLPNSWVNSADSKSNISKGLLSTFFMSLTLVLVSFSCTGPILGTLLVGSISGDGGSIDLTYGMLGFGLALSVPFTMLAFFPNVLSKLPKSGSWTNSVKVVLGFIELALAFKFLSNVDLVQGWGILKREVFVLIWVIIFFACGIYLLKDLRKSFSLIISLKSLIAYLFILSGLFMSKSLTENSQTKLSFLSGLLPPQFYSIYEVDNDCPLSLDCHKSFDKGLELSKKFNKPILLDFTGWACANCRRVEENTWSDPEVYDLINNKFILISLYVDDRTNLGDDVITLRDKNGNKKILEKVGEKWSAFQTLNFKINSQPYYVLISPELNILNSPIQYTDTETYKNWLNDGLHSFTSQNKLP